MAGEQAFKAVVNDTAPASGGKSFPMDITGANYNHFLGKKIGDIVEGTFVGEGDKSLAGYKLQITGGSDDVNKNSKEYRYKYDGLRRRRNLRGNVISQETRQINLKVVESGNRSLDAIINGEEAAVEQPSGEEE